MFKEKLSEIITILIVSLLGATITAVLSSEKEIWKVIKGFIAGMCGGILSYTVIMHIDIHQSIKTIIVIIFSSFISSIWPLINKLALRLIIKWAKNKENDIVSGS